MTGRGNEACSAASASGLTDVNATSSTKSSMMRTTAVEWPPGQSIRSLGDRLEHWPNVRRRTGDDLQDISRRRLPLHAHPQRVLGLHLFRLRPCWYRTNGRRRQPRCGSAEHATETTDRNHPCPEEETCPPRGAGFEASSNALDDTIYMLGMGDLLPAPTLHIFERRSCVVVPTLVVRVNPTTGVGGPGELADVVGEFAKAQFAFA